jgi:CRISPR/Cas system-associated exonuclease Cas4 (RecB family)
MQIEKLTNHPILNDLTNLYVNDWKKAHPYDKKPRLYFFVSDAGRCKRQLFYQFVEPEKKRDMASSTIMMFKMGDLFHDEVQQNLIRLKYASSKDIEFGTFGEAKFDPRGRLDAFIKENGRLVILDIKSKNSYAFEDEPNDEETYQLLFYIYQCKQDRYFSGRRQKIADYGYLLYVDRGGLSDMPFYLWKVEYSEEQIEILRAEFSRLQNDIQKKKIPIRGHERNSIKCNYCRFKELCWQGVPEEPKPLELEANPAIEKPEMELVESAQNRYIQVKNEIKEKEAEEEKLHDILERYFKATGNKETERLIYSPSKETSLDRDYLLSKLKDKWHLIAEPKMKLIQAAIKAKEVDPEVFERAKRIEYGYKILIKKEAKDANKKSVES